MSFRLRLFVAAARASARPLITRATNPAPLRCAFERFSRRILRPAPFTLVRDIRLGSALPAIVVSNRPGSHPPRRSKVIFYLHGGAFVAGAPRDFVPVLARIARLTRTEVVAPAYRLAPEHPFPAAVEDARSAWQALIDAGHHPGDIMLGGDSAGGNLALGLLAGLLAEGATPAGLFAFSPVTDLTFSGASMVENVEDDPILPAERRQDMARLYLGGEPPDDPRASPLLADFPHPPPVFLQFSSTEILADDSRRMAAKLRASGGDVTLDEWPNAPHVWVLLDGLLPEARIALRRVADFVNRRFDQAVTREAGNR